MTEKISIVFFISVLTAFTLQSAASSYERTGKPMNSKDKMKSATFAGGCFWCLEADFEKVDGVVKVISGYTGGKTENPSYREVCSGETGHLEAVQIYYDSTAADYRKLLEVFWRHIDPTDSGGQFTDRGTQYTSAIFYHDERQRKLAEYSLDRIRESGIFSRPIATKIEKLDRFWQAEEYHQNYHLECPLRYRQYREGSGRDRALEKIWNNAYKLWGPEKSKRKAEKGPSGEASGKNKSKEKLTALMYGVTQENQTEPPFQNEYWDNKREGIYVDAVSGEPLFASAHKFESGSGWPSFTRPLEPENLVEKPDRSHNMIRTEVRSKKGDSHLGHLFQDGPPPTGLRYCINSAALRFIPKDELEKEGYAEYLKLFDGE